MASPTAQRSALPAQAGADARPAQAITSVLQPIVDLATLRPVAFEALARSCCGGRLGPPGPLFDTARQTGRLAELDWACRAAAYEAALRAGLDRTTPLFVNVEPATLGAPPPSDLLPLEQLAASRLDVVLEGTERAITRRPADVLAAVDAARRNGTGVALDDVGADPASLALLPFVDPDVIKLDLRVVQDVLDASTVAVLTAVLAHVERSGASLLVEGVENEQHLARARALGARFAQGYLFGRPGEGRARPLGQAEWNDLHRRRRPWPSRLDSPFEEMSRTRPVQLASRSMLVAISQQLERVAARLADPAVVVAAFQDAAHYTEGASRRYERLARHCALVAALGVGLPPLPGPGVRGASIAAGDPLEDEWSVAVVSAHYSAALVARDLGADAEPDRRYAWCLTHDRELAVGAARALLARVLPR